LCTPESLRELWGQALRATQPYFGGRDPCPIAADSSAWFWGIIEPGCRAQRLLWSPFPKTLADLPSLFLLHNPSPRIGFGIECIHNTCLTVLGRMNIACWAVLARQNPIDDSHPHALPAILSRKLPLT
jgi:hypothetical protein